jgi:hypothetical protein
MEEKMSANPTQNDDIVEHTHWRVVTISEGLGKGFNKKKEAIGYMRELKEQKETSALWFIPIGHGRPKLQNVKL